MERQIIPQIQDWGKTLENIRVILLVGSRADPAATVDGFSEYDITLFVRDTEKLSVTTEWFQQFGNVLIAIREKVAYGGKIYPSR